MKQNLIINTDKAPNIVAELILRLKIKDIMTKKIITQTKEATLREIQIIMKEKRISGIPIVDGERLIGLISVDDIIKALDHGYINEIAEKYMSKQLVVLEDDMPLSFAISYLNRYSFGRFPVVDKERKLVGIITSRDILSKMIEEMNNEIKELEEKVLIDRIPVANEIYKEFSISKFDFEQAGKASFKIKQILKEKQISQKIIRRAAVASYELEINIAIHSEGGKLVFILNPEKIEIVAKDIGPGIKDISQVIKEGFSTANEWIRSLGFGAGMGLPNVKRVSDDFNIESDIGKGTTVTSIIKLIEDAN